MLVAVLVGWPLVLTFDLALRDVELFQVMRGVERELTFRNFERAVLTPRFLETLWTTVVYAVAATGLAFLWGLGTALLLDRVGLGRRFFRLAVMMP